MKKKNKLEEKTMQVHKPPKNWERQFKSEY